MSLKKYFVNDNERIRDAIKAFNAEFSYRLNGCELSFTGSRKKGFQLYFKTCVSGKIVCTIISGNCHTVMTAIAALSQFGSCPFSLLKPLATDSNIAKFVY
jgi:hypothetical protein